LLNKTVLLNKAAAVLNISFIPLKFFVKQFKIGYNITKEKKDYSIKLP